MKTIKFRICHTVEYADKSLATWHRGELTLMSKSMMYCRKDPRLCEKGNKCYQFSRVMESFLLSNLVFFL